MEQSELEVIRQCQAGTMDNFGTLYDAYIKKIYDFIFYKTLHKETAEDLTSQTFIKAFNNINSFDAGKGNFSSWLYRIAQNTVIDHIRTKKDAVGIQEDWDFASGENVQKDVENREHLDGVYSYLKTLNQEQRELVVMRIWDDLSFREIAEVTGKTEDSVKVMFSRVMKKMREELGRVAVFLAVLACALLFFLHL